MIAMEYVYAMLGFILLSILSLKALNSYGAALQQNYNRIFMISVTQANWACWLT